MHVAARSLDLACPVTWNILYGRARMNVFDKDESNKNAWTIIVVGLSIATTPNVPPYSTIRGSEYIMSLLY